MIMNMELFRSQIKVDICFAKGLGELKKSWWQQIALHLLQFVTMVVMIPVETLVFYKKDEVLSFFIIATSVSLLNLTSKFIHLQCQLMRPSSICVIATSLNHIIDHTNDLNEKEDSEATPLTEGVNVSSKIYNTQDNMTLAEATPPIRLSLENSLSQMIKTIALSQDPINRFLISVCSVLSFALFIYGIIVLSKEEPMHSAEMVVIILFLISEFLVQLKMYLCLLLLALSPLFCIFCICFVCFCKEPEKVAKLPEPVPATINIVQQTDGSPCSICFQDIILNEQVIILPCSEKHVFHDKCIKTWTTVKPACPICRHDLTE
jgi:hypothetical protein